MVEFHSLNYSTVHVIKLNFIVAEHKDFLFFFLIEQQTPSLVLLVDLNLAEYLIVALDITDKDVAFSVHSSYETALIGCGNDLFLMIVHYLRITKV